MVKRYIEGGYGLSEMEEDEQGDWVSYEDYLKLESEVKELRQQLEAVKPEKGDGWIEWGGGECPVGEGVSVDVKTRGKETWRNLEGAARLVWADRNLQSDIIAYRIVS